MIGCLYKIILKVISKRLKLIMGDVILETQTSSIYGRNISDGLITANEAISWLKKNKIQGALFKLDFKKAYDYVRWSFLRHMLEHMGFGSCMISWVMWCVSTTSLSILIYGVPCEPFRIQRGLRQGESISSFFFNIVVETLSFVIHRAC